MLYARNCSCDLSSLAFALGVTPRLMFRCLFTLRLPAGKSGLHSDRRWVSSECHDESAPTLYTSLWFSTDFLRMVPHTCGKMAGFSFALLIQLSSTLWDRSYPHFTEEKIACNFSRSHSCSMTESTPGLHFCSGHCCKLERHWETVCRPHSFHDSDV